MDIKQYLDSTYLKTALQAGISREQDIDKVLSVIGEAVAEKFKLVMIRPEHVALAKDKIAMAGSSVLVGTVIDFPLGTGTLEEKLAEAEKAISDGADELDFVINYTAFRQGDTARVRKEVIACTRLCRDNGKTVKWIIEVAALNGHEIVQLCALIKNCVLSHFGEDDYAAVFVKSSTGFYVTENGKPNGATIETVKLMLENSFPLPVKAAGGVRSYKEAVEMIRLGVKRIGTSSAKEIATGQAASGNY
ncbi:deoxyribose-phosphate aldolase [Flavobacterium cyanobacteriorum]|uniref:Deoxyribose-phosphate aldolase n=1 Tax=Flavobacterium cyanobacteriorum TaxID=2022802 RepID=A0A255Z9S3_9FLAO|nr:deoxyribose-phosphate aldolase [Flavobacterium cyanobacteriorum]OYQ38182.1 deoxyribose-phosphate aldolase [Flavobacterium cyanobacteriorum]